MTNDFFTMFYKMASIRPDTIAIKYKSKYLTYKEMSNLVNGLSNNILEIIGEEQNVPIVIYQNRGIEFIISMLAVLQAGAYYIPVEKPVPIERLKYICNEINPLIILTDEEQQELPYYYKQVILEEKNHHIKNVNVHRSDTNLAYIMYTSGTNGKAKGVKISYGNLCNLVNSFYDILYHKFNEAVNIAVISSFSFDASVKMIFPAFAYGNTLIIADKSVKIFGRKIHYFHKENNVLICDGTPSHLKIMTEQKTKILTEAQYFIIGGENLEYQTLKNFYSFLNRTPTIINVYGPTECCVDVTYNIVNKDDIFSHEGYVPIGKSFPNNYLEIRDVDQTLITKKFKKGELWIKGSQVGYGYANDELGGFIFQNNMLNRTYKTGDIAMYNEDNEIVILGRFDRQVKINGNRVELDEISYVLKELSECLDAEVELIQDNKRSFLVAFVVFKEGEKLSLNVLNTWLTSKLPQYMIPQKYIMIKNIPLTERGKVDRNYLKQIYFEKEKEELK